MEAELSDCQPLLRDLEQVQHLAVRPDDGVRDRRIRAGPRHLRQLRQLLSRRLTPGDEGKLFLNLGPNLLLIDNRVHLPHVQQE